MKNVITLAAILSLAWAGYAAAQDEPAGHSHDAVQASAPVEVGNKFCPVGGEAIDEMGVPGAVEYNGKIYNLCCEMCAKDFLKDPEKYSKIAEDEVQQGAPPQQE